MMIHRVLTCSFAIAILTLNIACGEDAYSEPSSESEIIHNQEVKLLTAELSWSCSSCVGFEATIEARNIAYVKNFTVIYGLADGTWKSFEPTAEFIGVNPGRPEYDRFKLTHPGSLLDILEGRSLNFALMYEVNGEVFWDNNCYDNYHLMLTGSHVKTRGRSCEDVSAMRVNEYLADDDQ